MKYHTAISYLKSGIRIVGYMWVSYFLPMISAGIFCLIIAEILGILEEVKE